MTVNFEIEENYAINYNGQYIDLHNNFDLVSHHYEISKRQLKLVWAKSSGSWVSENEIAGFALIHSNVSYFNVRYNHLNESPDDDKRLGEISYFPSSERETNNAFTSQTKPDEGDDILYVFESGYFIRIGCSEIEFKALRSA